MPIGAFELFLILLFAFLIFGPEKLPSIARTVGKAIAKFKDAQEEMSGVLKGEMIFDKDSDDPFKNPLDALDKVAEKAEKSAAKTKDAATAAKSAAGAVKDAGVSAATAAAGKVSEGAEAPVRTETFAERKARYDRERAERKAAEAEAARQAEEDARAAAPIPGVVAPKKVGDAADGSAKPTATTATAVKESVDQTEKQEG